MKQRKWRREMKTQTGSISLTGLYLLDRETKGALRYREVDSAGNPVTDLSGTIYLRKSAFPGGVMPKAIKVQVITQA